MGKLTKNDGENDVDECNNNHDEDDNEDEDKDEDNGEWERQQCCYYPVLYSTPPISAGIYRNPQEWDWNRTGIE